MGVLDAAKHCDVQRVATVVGTCPELTPSAAILEGTHSQLRFRPFQVIGCEWIREVVFFSTEKELFLDSLSLACYNNRVATLGGQGSGDGGPISLWASLEAAHMFTLIMAT